MFFPSGFPDTTATLAFSVFLLTFAYEDGATLLAASLAATGRMDIRIGFLSAFLGIWAGDLGLYLMGSTIGEKFVQHRWTRRFISGNAFAKAQSWFTRRGTFAIVMSRFVPGSRLPLYVAAGALKLPARRFSSVTGICSAVWVGAIFVAFRIVPGARLASPARLAAIAFATLMFPWMARMMGKLFRFTVPKLRLLWRKYSRWEFWPAWLFYPPVVVMCAWLALKYRGLALPTIANPSFRNGGIVGESKIEILRALMRTAPELVADGYSLQPAPVSQRVQMLRRLCEQHAIPYPLVLKPDVGQRGAGFKLAASEADAEKYLELVHTDLIVQRYAADEKEIGVFYYQLPGELHGEIFAVTEKVFPSVTGDGERTLEGLLQADKRASLISGVYLKRFHQLRGKVLGTGERLRLVEAGNHCQGCIFRDGAHLISPALRNRIDQVSRGVPGFFIGRYDIRYSDEAALLRGEDFTIIELNGAASEATNIYDERNTLLEAYRTLYQQWELVYRVGRANRDRGYRPASILGMVRDIKLYAKMSQSYPAAD